MASGVEANILAALMERLSSLSLTPALQIASPNVPYPAAGQTKSRNYLEVSFFPNSTRQITLGDDPQQHLGIMQVSVWYQAGKGMIAPLDIAGAIVEHFKGQVLFAAGIRITINAEPSIAAPIQDGDRVQVPVTIPYIAFPPET